MSLNTSFSRLSSLTSRFSPGSPRTGLRSWGGASRSPAPTSSAAARLVHLQPTKLLPPAIISLLHDLHFLAKSAPAYMLHTFGDSLTGGLWNGTWPFRLLSDFSWPWWTWSNFASGGFRTNDETPRIYNVVVDDTYVTTWLLGQNDGSSTSPMFDQFQHAVLAQNAWLAIPEGQAKFRAQSSAISQSGDWATSNIYPTTGLVNRKIELTKTKNGDDRSVEPNDDALAALRAQYEAVPHKPKDRVFPLPGLKGEADCRW